MLLGRPQIPLCVYIDREQLKTKFNYYIVGETPTPRQLSKPHSFVVMASNFWNVFLS